MKETVGAAERGHRCLFITSFRQRGPVNRPTRLLRKLPEEGTLGPSVALAERMDGVDPRQVMRYTLNEALASQPTQEPFFGKGVEHLGRIRFDVLWKAERVGLRDANDADLARPRIDIAKDFPMERAQVLAIVCTGNDPECEFGQGG